MSTTTPDDESIISSKYFGHQKSVLCLDVSRDPSSPFLLSGSEDTTARLWDLRNHRRRASLCIQAEGEVLSAVFAPRQPSLVSSRQETLVPDPSTLPKIDGPFALDFTVYLSVENGVYGYDLRNASVPIIRTPTTNLSSILQNQDEVNQIQVAYMQHQQQSNKGNSKRKSGGKGGSNKGKNYKGTSMSSQSSLQASMYLAAADDAGTVRFMDTSTMEGSMTPSSDILHHDPNGVAVVPTCAFRPRCVKGLELASGGTDCKIHLWDVLKPRRPIASYTITPIEETAEESNKPQICNPPMVHTLAWSNSGRLLASGLGDGNSYIFGVENRSLVQVGLLSSGHDASVASILFPSFSSRVEAETSNTNRGGTELTSNIHDDRIVLSAGSDGAILCWDLGSIVRDIQGGKTSDNNAEWDPSSLFPSSLLQTSKTAGNRSAYKSMDELSLLDKPRILFGIPHGSKPNWMVSRNNPATLYVADTTNDITEYTIPLR